MLGVALALFAAVCYGIATAIQKYSMAGMENFSVRKLARSRMWLLSVAVTLLGGLAYLFALKAEPLSTVQPFLGITVLVPVVAGLVLFRERLGVLKCIGIALLMAGITMVSIY